MSVNRRVIYWLVVFVVLLLTFWFGFIHKSGRKEAPEKVIPVEVDTVGTGSIQETIELTGWIKANTVVDIKSKVPGRIESLQAVDGGDRSTMPVEEGLAVKKGQQLAVIDHNVYLAQVAAAEAELEAKQVELADAEREKKRIVALYEGGSATQQGRDKAVTAAKLAAAREAFARANLELAQINLTESVIVSPIDGVVTAKHIDEGNLVSAGSRIVTVADIRTVKIIAAIAEKYSEKITAATPAKIKVDAFSEKVFDATVYSVHPALDAQTGTVQIEIRLENNGSLLKPGMFARVTLITKEKNDVVVVPRDIVLGGKVDEPYVYVVKDDIAYKRHVDVGIVQAEKFEIAGGLQPGETVVVNGMNYLTEGISVEVVRIEDIK